MQITREIFSLKIQLRYFEKLKHVVTKPDKFFFKNWILVSIPGATECKTRTQVQIFSTIKCIRVSEVILTIHIAHPFITPWI